jgi:hypothetical protein
VVPGDDWNGASNPVSDTAIIALAGRRIDADDVDRSRFPSRNVPIVRERLAKLFAQENSVALVSSAACGSDLIGLEEAERSDIRCRIVLPFSPEKFRATSVVDRPGGWGSSFDHLVALAENQRDLVILEQGGSAADAAYAAVNTLILHEATMLGQTMPGAPHRLVAVIVWEGQPRPDNDLTDDFKTAAIEAGFTLHIVLTHWSVGVKGPRPANKVADNTMANECFVDEAATPPGLRGGLAQSRNSTTNVSASVSEI